MIHFLKRLFLFSALVAGYLGGSIAWAQTPASEDQIRKVILEELPWDATMIVAASILTMRGRDKALAKTPVILASVAKTALRDPTFPYKGFGLTGYALTAYGEPSTIADAVTTSAILSFTHTDGRRKFVSLIADYGVAGDKIEIKSASVRTLKPPKPEGK